MVFIDQLNFSYKESDPIFKDLDLQLVAGKIYGLLGTNGAGKTSLIKMIMGLYHRKSGNIRILDMDPSLRLPTMLQETFLLSEDVYEPEISLRSFVEMYSPFYPRFDLNLFFELLGYFSVSRKSFNSILSLGQRKKAMVAFGLATNTRLLVLDEPTNGLDIPSKRQFRNILSNFINPDRLFLISTHQIRDLHSLLDSLIILQNGQIVLHQDIDEISRKISFKVSPDSPADGDGLYYERIRGGYLIIKPGADSESLEVDLEVFFNAVTTMPDKFARIFQTRSNA